MHALYLVVPALWHRRHRLPLLQRVHRRQGDDARRFAQDAGAHEVRRRTTTTRRSRWVLFGHHFAAITGAGPLIGPVLAAQFGCAPGFIWLLAGCRASPAPSTT